MRSNGPHSASVKEWIEIASQRANAAYHYGKGQWIDCHSWGTSVSPNCCPQGMKDSNGYFHVRLWHGQGGALAVADVTITHAGEEPTAAEASNALLSVL